MNTMLQDKETPAAQGAAQGLAQDPTQDATQDDSGWVEVARLEDLPALGARVIEGAARGPIALFRAQDDHVFALLDRCPHRGGPLSQGVVHGHTVTCPLHAWKIGLDSGEAVAPDQGCVHRYAVRVQDGCIQLKAAELAARG